MNHQLVRRVLPLALALGLCAGISTSAQAQLAANGRTFNPPAKTLQPSAQDKAGGATSVISNFGCDDLMVVIAGTAASVSKVSCDHGFFDTTVPVNNSIVSGEPAVIFLQQSVSYGPDCTITLTGGGSTAVVTVQQNFCAAQAGQVTASVVSGSATFNGSTQGSFASSVPGIVWFTLGF